MLLTLRVDVVDPAGGTPSEAARVSDVVVETDGHHVVGDVVSALVEHLGVPSPVLLVSSGEVLDPSTPFEESGLVHGDVVQLRRSSTPPERAIHRPFDAISADIVAGPGAGSWFVLHPGRYVVGRARTCDLVLDDPEASRRHAVIVVADDWSVAVEPLDGERVHVGGHRLDGRIPVGCDDVVTVGSSRLLFRPNPRSRGGRSARSGQVDFQRTPYRPPVVSERTVQRVGPAPQHPGGRRFQVLAALAPLAAGLVLFAFSRQAQFLALTLVSPLVMIANVVEDRRSGRRLHRDEIAAFRDELVCRRADAARMRRAECVERWQAAPDLVDLARRAFHRSLDLWPRGRDAPDFLCLRVGTGTVDARFTVDIDRVGDPRLHDEAQTALSGATRIDGAPIVVDVAAAGVVGMHGPDALVDALASSLIMQAACLHSPDDLTIVAAVPPERSMGWLKWLPHLRAVTSPVGCGHLARSAGAAHTLVASLHDVVAHRREHDVVWPRVLVVIDATIGVDPAEIARLLDSGPQVGVSVLWTAPHRAGVPHQATQVVELSAGGSTPGAAVWSTDPAQPVRDVAGAELLRCGVAERVARWLAPVRDVSAGSLAASVPRMVDLLSAIGGDAAAPRGVVERWLRPRPYGLAFPVGVGAAGPVEIDLVHDGPHALVAGTSGAGKSELLQTVVASLASRYPPERVTLLFVDYKGGAASGTFATLPHTVGYVTNLDAALAMRALTSLRAELQHRMTLLEGRAKDLEEMLAIAPDQAPPSLVIVVDEFATLVKEIPEFVAGIVDVAQRGRSLGIHLLLATQRPSGAVNENILANTNLRICLRMPDRAESTALVGTPEAADIPVPLRGRALARLGAQQPVPFQCAFGGAPLAVESVSPVLVADFVLPDDTPRGTVAQVGVARSTGSTATQLSAVVEAIERAHLMIGGPPPRRPWCEALPEVAVLADLLADPRSDPARRWPGRVVLTGLLDAPERQEQHPLLVDLEDGGLLVFGSGGAGKTTLLRTIAASIQSTSAPDEASLLAFDFASQGLRALRALPAVVDVATLDDAEAVTRHILALEQEIERRRVALAAAGAEHLSAYNARHPGLPRLVVLIDGFGAVVDALGDGSQSGLGAAEAWGDRLVRLVVDGRHVGLHAVITADRRNAVPARLHATIPSKLVMRHADETAYANHGIPQALARAAELSPGRGLWRGSALVQVASVSAVPEARAQGEALARIAAAAVPPGEPAVRSRRLPDSVPVRAIDHRSVGRVRHRAVFGLVDVTGAPAVLDIAASNAVVTGPPRSGRSNALAVIATALDTDHDVYRLGPSSSGLARVAGGRRAFGRDDVPRLLERIENVFAMGDPVRPIVLMIDDLERLDDPAMSPTWQQLVDHDGLRFVAAVESRSLATFTAHPLLAHLKRARRLLVLQPDDPAELVQLTGRRIATRPGLSFPPGRGVLLEERGVETVQVALLDASTTDEMPSVTAAPRVLECRRSSS